MNTEAMKLALDALIDGDWYIGQLETIVYSSDDNGMHAIRAKAQNAIKALEEALAKQEQGNQELDLSKLKPENQQQMQEWIADGSFAQRAIDTMFELSQEITALAKQEQGEPDGTGDTLFRQFMSEAKKAGLTHWSFSFAQPTPVQQEQGEPVAWVIWFCGGPAGFFEKEADAIEEFERRNLSYPDESRKLLPLYTTPLQRTWVDLTYQEITEVMGYEKSQFTRGLIQSALAKLKEKNT